MISSWTFAVDRDDLSRTTLVTNTIPGPHAGEALLRVDRVGLTANNVTYAVLGKAMRYWEFFPARVNTALDACTWGLTPLWGFSEVIASTVDGVEIGQRVYGYLPPSGHLTVRPDRVDGRGFRDASDQRAHLPSAYNVYRLTTGDPAYEREREDLLVLFRPLFFTSFMLADELTDRDFFGALTVVLSSASSRTAYATAFQLRGRGCQIVGLTSADNAAFVAGLGCYDQVLTYQQIDQLDPARATAYVDLAGHQGIRTALRLHLGSGLVRDIAVGLTHQAPEARNHEDSFFAPVRIRKRTHDWGRDGLDARFSQAWRRFAPLAETAAVVTVDFGPQALRAAWLEVLGGRTPPRIGRIIAL